MYKPKLVALTGAGISAESGLKTFRDSDGLWEGYRVEDVATPEAWHSNRNAVQRFYNERRAAVLAARPNAAHLALAQLQADFDVQIVTQNIDDLHERAGSRKVLHLHGEILKMRSELAPHTDSLATEIQCDILETDLCPKGGRMRPHIVWFGEQVPAMELAVPIVQAAEVFVLIGTSLVVYPAAGLIDYVGAEVPKYVIDRQLPPLRNFANLTGLEMTATEGAAELLKLLHGSAATGR